MNREEARELLPLIQAFADGKAIQVEHAGKWVELFLLPQFKSPGQYRIKPEPRLRPWEPEEAPVIAMVRRKSGLGEVHIAHRTMVNGAEGNVVLLTGGGFSPHETRTLDDLCAHWVRIAEDGSEHPCGIVEDAP